MSEGRPWYETGMEKGFDGIKREQERIDSMGGPRRIWMPPDSSKDLVFVDDVPAAIHEHNPKINGDWKNWITCLKNIEDTVPCCDILGANTRYYVGYFTVIDCTPWTDKKGNTYQYELKLLPAKLKTLKKLQRKKEARGSLIGAKFKATREDKKSPTVGDEFEFIGEADMAKAFASANYHNKKMTELFAAAGQNPDALAKLKKTFQVATDANGLVVPKLVPFNYMQILQPMSSSEMKSFLSGAKVERGDFDGKEPAGDGAKADEEVPF
jgi:hypothetical protein